VPATVLSYRDTLTIVESIYYSVSCSHTMTEHRTAVIGNISYPAAERVYTMLGESGRTDIGWTFTGLPATILKPASPVTMVYRIRNSAKHRLGLLLSPLVQNSRQQLVGLVTIRTFLAAIHLTPVD
jgi:hypothetical protein